VEIFEMIMRAAIYGRKRCGVFEEFYCHASRVAEPPFKETLASLRTNA